MLPNCCLWSEFTSVRTIPAETVLFSTAHSWEDVGQCRSEAMRHFVAKAKELAGEERVFKDSLSKRREVLSSKRLLLFIWLLDKSEFTDANARISATGFETTGTFPSSHTFRNVSRRLTANRCSSRSCSDG